eukprot:SAG25_NODE_546_length_7028_cov_5.882523_2_plen_51_part_00
MADLSPASCMPGNRVQHNPIKTWVKLFNILIIGVYMYRFAVTILKHYSCS